MKWIADRKRDLALLEAHQNLVDTLGDLNAAVVIGQLSIPGVVTRMESAEANTKAALPLALEALEAVLAFATAERDKISRTYIVQPNTAYAGYANAMDDVIRTVETALRAES